MAAKSGQHTMWSGAGLVIANMIGVGVLLSTGFMAQDMSSGPIMLAWVIGAVIAGLGVVSYAGLVSVIGESGGEYRFLSDLFHPFLGYLAGWGSLILGFSAAIAVEIPEAPVGGTLFRVLFLTGILLFAFTMVLTTAADLVGSYLRKRYARF